MYWENQPELPSDKEVTDRDIGSPPLQVSVVIFLNSKVAMRQWMLFMYMVVRRKSFLYYLNTVFECL